MDCKSGKVAGANEERTSWVGFSNLHSERFRCFFVLMDGDMLQGG
jgi:hypothetical protein